MKTTSRLNSARPPLHRLKKDEIVWLGTHTCKAHGHAYLEHYNCYLKEKPRGEHERIGFLDIEASNLAADFGIMLTWAIKKLDGEVVSSVIRKEDVEKAKAGDEDRELTKELVTALKGFDRVITYYGTKFDIPYIRTRAVSMNIPFPNFGTLKHNDMYYVMKHRFKLSSNRLENANRVLLGKTDKTRVDAKYWRGGQRGEKASLDYILDHNIKDVKDLEKLYKKIINYTRRTDTSM